MHFYTEKLLVNSVCEPRKFCYKADHSLSSIKLVTLCHAMELTGPSVVASVLGVHNIWFVSDILFLFDSSVCSDCQIGLNIATYMTVL